MQEHIQDPLLAARQMQHDLSLRVAALDPKPDTILVSHVTNPSFAPPPEQRYQNFRTPFKEEVPCFDGIDPLG